MPQSKNSYEFGATEMTVRVDPKQEARFASQFEVQPSGQRRDSSFEAPLHFVAGLKR